MQQQVAAMQHQVAEGRPSAPTLADEYGKAVAELRSQVLRLEQALGRALGPRLEPHADRGAAPEQSGFPGMLDALALANDRLRAVCERADRLA
jgi:hypothetical protein